MNVLSITGILPIPGIDKSNDFLIPLFRAYKAQYKEHNVYIFRMEKCRPFSKHSIKYRKTKNYDLEGIQIKLLRYFSVWRYPNLHSFISSYSAYYFNRRLISKFIREKNISIIHAENIIPDGYIAYLISKKFKIPFLVTTHNEFRYFYKYISLKVALRVLRSASFITPLNYTALKLFKNYNLENVIIVPHGIEEEFIKTCAKQNSDHIIRILSIGVLIPLKNFDKVILALSNLKDCFDFVYTIIGNGPEKNRLALLVEENNLKDRVKFIKRVPYSQIANEISKHDIFIMPSFFETFGRALTEAMAVGLPIICAKNTGIHGYFKEGVEGFSVDHNDQKDIEDKLYQLMNSPELRQKIGANAKKLMQQYTWENVAKTFHNLYHKSIM